MELKKMLTKQSNLLWINQSYFIASFELILFLLTARARGYNTSMEVSIQQINRSFDCVIF